MRVQGKISLLSVLLCAGAAMLLMMAGAMYLSARGAEQGMEKILDKRLEKARDEQVTLLQNIYYTTRNTLGNVMYDSEIYRILRDTKGVDVQAIRTMRDKLRMVQNVHLNNIEYRMVLLDMNGNMYTNWLRGAGYYQEIISQPEITSALEEDRSFFVLRHPFWYVDDENPIERVSTISFGSVVLDQYQPIPIGILLFSVEEDSLVAALERGCQVAVTNMLTGERLCGSAPPALQEYVHANPDAFPVGTVTRFEWQEEKMLVCRNMIASSNIELMQFMPFSETYFELVELRHLNGWIMAVLMTAMILLLTGIVSGISVPLRRIYQQVCALNIDTNGNIARITTKGYRECAEVAQAINDMSTRTMDMIRVIERQERDRAELKYQHLISQLDPHFLLNTLNNLKWTAYMNHAPKVAEMIIALGFLLETSLGKNQGEVTIGHEIQHIQNYMLLQSMHFGQEVACEVHEQADLHALPFERFTLITLVGNAIKHGYVKGKQLSIHVFIETDATDLLISVTDNGKGISPERLLVIRQELSRLEGGYSGHIGLRNLHQRLLYRYGKQVQMNIESVEGEMTRISLRVPLHCLRKEEEKADV